MQVFMCVQQARDPLAISTALVLIFGICDISEWMPDILPVINPLFESDPALDYNTHGH